MKASLTIGGIRRLLPYIWLLPALTLLIPFFIIPLGILVRNSVYRDTTNALLAPDFTFVNYFSVLTNPHYFKVFTNSLSVAAGVGFISLLVGFPFAYFIVRWAARSRVLLIWVVYIPLTVSVIVRVFGWIVITNDSGLINNALLGAGLIHSPFHLLYAVPGLVIGVTHRYLPLMVLPLVNALSKIDPTLISASENLGAGRMRTMFGIVIPLSTPGMVVGFQLVFSGVLSDYVLPNLLGTPTFPMLATSIYNEAIGNLRWATASAMSVVMIACVVVVLLATNASLRRLAPWAQAL